MDRGREDCWSEGATETLISSWGGRYAQLNRGILRQKDWNEVAETVNARQGGVKPPKTEAQCKNRVDTLKKKYKLEKSKPLPSKWPFFSRLETLIGPNSVPNKHTNLRPNSESLPLPSDSSVDGVEDEVVVVRKRYSERVDYSSGGDACRELAMAILRFGEIYEAAESSKQKMVMELERQRMKFTKDLEIQRMNMFIDTQLEIQKMKRSKYNYTAGSGKKV